MDRVENLEENDKIPDDLSLLLRSSGPEPEDYVANLDQDKHTQIYEEVYLNITLTSEWSAPTWKSRFKNSLARALLTLQIW